jgi:hypothetical protein
MPNFMLVLLTVLFQQESHRKGDGMRRQLLASLFRLLFALALFVAVIAPKKTNAMTCTSMVYGTYICYQCYVYSPLGWVAIGDPQWDDVMAP